MISYLFDSSSVNGKAVDEMRVVKDVNTEEEFNAVSDEFNTKASEGAQAAASACPDLQGMADDARIEVDLQCGQ